MDQYSTPSRLAASQYDKIAAMISLFIERPFGNQIRVVSPMAFKGNLEGYPKRLGLRLCDHGAG